MKRHILPFALLCLSLVATAQTHLRLWHAGQDSRMKIATVGDITFHGQSLTLKGQTYALASIDSIEVVPEVTVQYNGTAATVRVPEAIAADVTVATDGAHVTLTNRNVAGEVEIRLAGTATDGSLTYVGQYKCGIILDGLTLTSQRGAAIDIQCGKRIALTLADGTVNTLTDSPTGLQKACLYTKGHLEIEGGGELNVAGRARHAISTKEYLQLKRSTGTVNIVQAAADAIHCKQYFQMNGGTLNIDAQTQADGIQAEYATLDDDLTPDPEKELNGQIIVKGGTINVVTTHEDAKAVKADADITITGGTFRLTAQAGGSRGIQSDGSIAISETDAPTLLQIAAAGDKCTLAECAADPHKCMGIKADGDLHLYSLQDASTITVTGKKAKGIKVGGTCYLHGHTQYQALVDCLNIVTE